MEKEDDPRTVRSKISLQMRSNGKRLEGFEGEGTLTMALKSASHERQASVKACM